MQAGQDQKHGKKSGKYVLFHNGVTSPSELFCTKDTIGLAAVISWINMLYFCCVAKEALCTISYILQQGCRLCKPILIFLHFLQVCSKSVRPAAFSALGSGRACLRCPIRSDDGQNFVDNMGDGALVVGDGVVCGSGLDLWQGVGHGDGDVGFPEKREIVGVVSHGDHAPVF